MIWIPLYPWRKTTEPPILDPENPIRSSFTRWGSSVARHPILALLISVALATTFVCPFPFLVTNSYKSGASNLPQHVWSSADVFLGGATTPDVVMRSIWVHGDYMKAFDPKVLLGALEIQDELLGPTIDFHPRKASDEYVPYNPTAEFTMDMRDSLHAANGLTNSSWFFHSPLQYWSCSSETISKDTDIISTVNQHNRQITSVNVTLRPSFVFSGKRVENHRVVAADALVITLIHKLDSPVGGHWERNAEQLALRLQNSDKFELHPSDGRSVTDTLYEFRFEQASDLERLLFRFAYLGLGIHITWTLWSVRALKSRLGLLAAIAVQMAFSILSTWTVCAALKIDLSRIPSELYPLVIIAPGVQNILTLTKALIKTPSGGSNVFRIGEALGQIGHVALASTGLIIFGCRAMSFAVHPQIVPFCTFVIIGLTFDFFYFLTFFTAVLSVDVRRAELGDSLTAESTRRGGSLDMMLHKRTIWEKPMRVAENLLVPRLAYPLGVLAAVLISDWHFLNGGWLDTTYSLLPFSNTRSQLPRSSLTSTLSATIHQERPPTDWLRLQHPETAHEVISIIKPHAASYVARVYQPLVFVLKGSDRTPNGLGVRTFLPAAYDFVHHHLRWQILTMCLILLAVWLLMSYLLRNEQPEEDGEDEKHEDGPLLSISTLPKSHRLDVVLLTASKEGIIVSVGLDRTICVRDHRNNRQHLVRSSRSNINPFPILAMALDMDSKWLALLSKNGSVYLWNIQTQSWGPSMVVEINGRCPLSFFFGFEDTDKAIRPLILVRQNGLMSELHMDTQDNTELQICRSSLISARHHIEKSATNNSDPPTRIITSSRRGCVHVATHLPAGWISEGMEEIEVIPLGLGTTSLINEEIISVVSLPTIVSFLAVRSNSVNLVGMATRKITHTFETRSIKKGTLKCFHSTRRRPQCGSVGLSSLAIAYISAETGDLIMQSYLPQHEGDTICFRGSGTPGSKTCCLWVDTIERIFIVEDPGFWEAVPTGYLVGVRKATASIAPEIVDMHATVRRRGPPPRAVSNVVSNNERFEVWTLSARGERFASPLCGLDERSALLVSDLGPLTKFGDRSIAIGLGNNVKVISIGHEKFDSNDADDNAYVGMLPAGNRRKKDKAIAKKTS